MDSRFHSANLTTRGNLTSYQSYRALTIGLLLVALGTLSGWAQPLSPFATRGFAPPGQHLLAPLLRLAPAGHASEAMQIFDRIHQLDRKLILHPALSPQLQALLDKLPPPEVISIEMPSLYNDADISWRSTGAGSRYLPFDAKPSGADYVYGLAGKPDPPIEPGLMEGTLTLIPQPQGAAPPVASVVSILKGLLYISDSMTPERGIDTALAFGREIYGTLAPPWDERPGIFNQHDKAALARLKRDLPATAERLEHYFEIHNLLDEFSDGTGPWVLFNLDAEVRDAALAAFPKLQEFWRETAQHIDAQSIVRDGSGHRWLLAGLHHGHITLTFVLRDGRPAPMDPQGRPAGAPIRFEQIEAGHFYTENTIVAERFGMRFGMARIRAATTYRNRDGAISFEGHMTEVPQLIAPPIIHRVTMLLAGQFLETVARGNAGRGLTQTFAAVPGPMSGTMLTGSISAELRNAPALALLVRMAAAFAPDYGAEVRDEQRRLTAEFLDAFDSDYRRARPVLLSGYSTSVQAHF
jgi:hypothetical protein